MILEFSLIFTATKPNSRKSPSFSPINNSICSQIHHQQKTLQRHFTAIRTHHIQQLLSLKLKNTMSLIPSIFGRRSSDPFSMDVWDPFRDWPLVSGNDDTSQFAATRVDWKETPEAHVFKADVPGLKKEEVKVEMEEGNVLQISGERSRENQEKNDTWHRVERSSGKFLRRFRLPESAKTDEVKASMENGVLTVTVPKAEVKKPEVKAIDISG